MINVDISNVWGEISLPDLLAVEAEVAAAHQMLDEGTGQGGGMRGWMELPMEEPAEEIAQILAAAEQIRENSDALVVIGIGGACLGARAAIELLQGANHNIGKGKGNPRIFFAGNSLSTRHWNELLRLLEGRDISLCVISKSGDDLEPAIALRSLRWMLERKYGTDEARKRIYAVTDGENGPLYRMAAEEGWQRFVIPENVGGCYSVLSPGGLLPMAAAGIDITAALKGAWEAKEEYNLRSFENPVWLYAAVRSLMQRNGKLIEVLSSFEPEFRMMGRWWQQLFRESEGKDGKGIFPATAELTEDLYAQLIQYGQRNLFETMVRFDPPETPMVIGEDVKDLDELNYLAGKRLDFVEAVAYESAVNDHVDGGIGVICMDCGELDDKKVGELFWFFQLSCAISAYLLGVNPFDLSGVESCRQNLFHLLGKPAGEGE